MLKEKPLAVSIPGKCEPPLDVCLHRRRGTHMVMEGLGLGADLNETASEDPAHFGGKGQLANEGEQLPLCAPS